MRLKMVEKTLKRIPEKTINETNKNSNEKDFTVTDFFTTDFGKELSENFLDLGYFIATATMLPPIIKPRNSFMEFVFSEKMIKMLEKSVGKDSGPTREEIEQVKKTLNSIKSLLEEEERIPERYFEMIEEKGED